MTSSPLFQLAVLGTLVLIIVVCLLSSGPRLSYSFLRGWIIPFIVIIVGVGVMSLVFLTVKTGVITQVPSAPTTVVVDRVVSPPTVTAALIDQVLTNAHSPAQGLGTAFYRLGVQYGIDPAFALAFFHHESTYGTRGVARVTHSIGNIRCTAGYSCFGGYRSYGTWAQGIADWYRFLSTVYVGQKLDTVAAILPVYAPADDGNDVNGYIHAVMEDVARWREGRV